MFWEKERKREGGGRMMEGTRVKIHVYTHEGEEGM